MATIRPERETDWAAIAEVHRRAFGKDSIATLVEVLRASDRFVPALSLVAEVDGRVVGHVALTYVDLEDRRILYLSPMGVRPEWQRRGIGSELVRAALERARERGEELVVLEGVPAYYPRFGFVRASSLGLELNHECPDEAWLALELVPGAARGGGVVSVPRAFEEAG